ncbi:MAG TPA: FHA domain-containing protein [Mycobacteriales bacterium]|nr:FHA domain-containing protein [Mycobacteriales bacterium]
MPATCPNGHQSATGDWCDECGAPIGAAADPSPAGDPGATAQLPVPAGPGGLCAICGAAQVGTDRFCENDGYDFHTGQLPGTALAPAEAAGSWALTVTADRRWHQEMAADLPFPDRCPVRTFRLTGPQVLLGRPRPSRGINPQVDLTGPPCDEGISHAHALLTRTDEGWQLSDAGSTNGTWLPGAAAPLAAGQHVLLGNGDTFYLGAWTAVTVHAS